MPASLAGRHDQFRGLLRPKMAAPSETFGFSLSELLLAMAMNP
jgi:hypothetical protein